MTTETRCQNCGTPVAVGALFCSRCGVDVTAVNPAEAATVEMPSVGSPSPRVKSTMRQTLRDATLGEYEILDELGRGGMATVFLAHDIALDRKVAIKVMAPHLLEGEGMAERFKLEARTAAQLSHPHIIPIYAVRETESTLFFVMKYVEGRTLDEIIKKTGPLPIPMVKDVLGKVGAALGYAHRRNVIHRDVKPGNIMIDEEGTPIVTDFGIAKVAEKKGLTMTGTTIGTPAYMSPEQCEAKLVTGASDQYSLGVVAWEMLTGKTPFSGDSAVTTMYKHCHEPLPPLSDFRPDCPPEVLEAVTRMLAKGPTERWPSLEAAVTKLGAGTQSTLDPIRSQLLELASQPEGRELIARMATPRTAMPGLATATAGAHAAAPATPAPEPKRRSPVALVATVVLLVVGGSAAVVLRPWERGAATSGESGGAAAPGAQTGDGAAPSGELSSTPPEPAQGGTGAAPTPSGSSTGGAGSPPASTSSAPAQSSPATTRPAGPAPASVESVQIGGVRSGLEPGDLMSLTATALDARGQAVTGASVVWSTSDPSVGRIAPDGSFTAVAAGSVTVTARIGDVSARETIGVSGASVTSLAVDPASLTLTAGERRTVTATARDRSGNALPAAIAWSSSDGGVATVSERGEVLAARAGRATLTATSGGATATLSVTVEAAPVDARTAIPEIIGAYARALESRDINAVRAAYPGMTIQQERNLSGALANLERAVLNVGEIREQGERAEADVSGTYTFNLDGRRTDSAVSFRATFERAGGGWQMTATQDR
jgi:serine/threonine-protein kinase